MATMSPGSMFVPPLPTLWPSMLVGSHHASVLPPFGTASARYFYFCRNAIWLSVKLLKLEDTEVLVPAYHHGVEVEALVDAGAKVRFYGVGPRWDVDLEDVKRKIGPKTRAIYLIHYAGFPGPSQQLRDLANEHKLLLLEDCALSLLSSDGQRPLGTTGDVSYFCLYKTLPVPNGGALVVNGLELDVGSQRPTPPRASTASHLLGSLLQNFELRAGFVGRWARGAVRKVGHRTVKAANVERVSTGTQHFNREHVELGMSPLTQRIAQKQDFAEIITARRRNYSYLLGALQDRSAPLMGHLAAGICPLFYPLQVDDKTAVMERLKSVGIETIDFWRHSHPLCDVDEFPAVKHLRETVLELPCHQDLTPRTIKQVAAQARLALGEGRRLSA